MIKEINGRYTCTKCGYEWSAMLSDDQIPEKCECEQGLSPSLPSSDDTIQKLWDALTDIPLDEDDNGDLIWGQDFHIWKKGEGITREEIWHWFDENHSKGVAWLMGLVPLTSKEVTE